MKKTFRFSALLSCTLALNLMLLAWAGPNEDLSRAILDFGTDAEVLKALEQGADPNLALEGPDGWRPLNWFAATGNLKLVKILVEKGAALDSRDNFQRTPLHAATVQFHQDVIAYLLSQGASLDARDASGSSPLEAAAFYGRSDIEEYLLAQGAALNPPNRLTALMWAAGGGHPATVQLLLDRGADVNATDSRGVTALMMAALGGYDYQPESGEPGMMAMGYSDQELAVVRLLLTKGADIHAKTRDGKSVLMYAALNGDIEVAKLLLAKGADFSVKDGDGQSALSIAAEKGHNDMWNLLAEQGAGL